MSDDDSAPVMEAIANLVNRQCELERELEFERSMTHTLQRKIALLEQAHQMMQLELEKLRGDS